MDYYLELMEGFKRALSFLIFFLFFFSLFFSSLSVFFLRTFLRNYAAHLQKCHMWSTSVMEHIKHVHAALSFFGF